MHAYMRRPLDAGTRCLCMQIFQAFDGTTTAIWCRAVRAALMHSPPFVNVLSEEALRHRLRAAFVIITCRWVLSFVAFADIAPPGGAPVRPFSVDPRIKSTYEIADELWAAIGDAHGVGAA